MTTFFNTQLPATLTELDSLECDAGVVFPSEYRNHLLQYNGGQCSPNVFRFSENGKVTSSFIDWFLATQREGWGSLKDYIETFKVDEKRIPSHLIPIAFDPGGNLVCLSCAGNDVGAIYFWDHENEVDYSAADDNNYSNLYFVANSLHQFLSDLEDFEEETT